jgi:predicted GNAT family N-acyltransferase
MLAKEDFLSDKCFLSIFDENTKNLCQPFECGDKDLDDFFKDDALNYNNQLLGKTFCFKLKSDSSFIVCAFTLSTSSIEAKRLPNSRKKKLTENLPHEKSLSSYPAILIGRLGVNQLLKGQGVGKELINNVIKPMFRNFQIGCRYLTVDAYNTPQTLKFYEATGFKLFFSTEQQEKEHIGMPENIELKTRLMFFDLLQL